MTIVEEFLSRQTPQSQFRGAAILARVLEYSSTVLGHLDGSEINKPNSSDETEGPSITGNAHNMISYHAGGPLALITCQRASVLHVDWV